MQGDLISGLIMGISRALIWVKQRFLTYLLISPDSPSRA